MPEDDLAHPETDDEILRKVRQFRSDGVSGSTNFYDRMRKAEDFVIGEQWDPQVKDQARRKGKFTLTIPIVKPNIKQIAGAEIQNPQDFIVQNTQGGAATIARILTALTKQAADSERVRYEKSQTFESGLSSGQGAIGVFLDKRNDPKHADLRIERLNEHNTMVDPNTTSYNPNKANTGAKWIIYEEWVDKEKVHVEYPDKKEDLSARGSQSFLELQAGNVRSVIDWLTGRRSTRETGAFGSRERQDFEVMTQVRYLKSHTWWREPKKRVHWFDNRESELEAAILTEPKEMKEARRLTKANPEVFSIEEVTYDLMHHTIRVGDTFLEDRKDELNGVEMYPVVFYWPYWINGYKSGVAEDLIGTQEEINWTHSMGLNLMKMTANTGYKIKQDKTGGEFTDWLRDHAGEHGIVIDESKGGGEVERIDPPPFPTFELLTQQAMNNVKTITGRLDLPERDPKSLSGKAKAFDIQKTQQGSMSLMNNWFYTLSILGDLVVDVIRKNDIFSLDEIVATIDEDDLLSGEIKDIAIPMALRLIRQQGLEVVQRPEPVNPIRMANSDPEEQAVALDRLQRETAEYQAFVERVEAMAQQLAPEIVQNLIGKFKLGKYNTKVTLSPMSVTMRSMKAEETFALHKLLIESGDLGLDGDDLIDATDAPNKEQLKQGRQDKIQSLQRAG